MIKVGLQIGSGSIQETYSTWGFIYMSSDNILGAPTKELESTSYPEEPGMHYYPQTVDDAFDYKVSFLVESNGNLESVNAKIASFNSGLYTEDSSHIKTLKKVTLYNYHKSVKIVGYATPISGATDFWRDKLGRTSSFAQVEFVIHVENPLECNFNYSQQ